MARTGKRTTVGIGVYLGRPRLLLTGALIGLVALPAGSTNLAETGDEALPLATEAEEVIGEDETAMTANGLVLAVTGTRLAVASVSKGQVEVWMDSATVILREGAPLSRADLLPGDQVRATGSRISAHAILAREVTVQVPATADPLTVSTITHHGPEEVDSPARAPGPPRPSP